MASDRAHDILAASSSLTAVGRALGEVGSVVDLQPGNQLDALVDAVRALGAAGVRAALIGGLAVGVRSAVPRATIDVDLATGSGVDRSLVVTALAGAGFEHRGSYPHTENFRHATGEPVQVAFDPAMDAAVDRAEAVTVAGQRILVVRTEDLIALKERAGNDPSRRRSKALRDLADAALLREGGEDPDAGW